MLSAFTTKQRCSYTHRHWKLNVVCKFTTGKPLWLWIKLTWLITADNPHSIECTVDLFVIAWNRRALTEARSTTFYVAYHTCRADISSAGYIEIWLRKQILFLRVTIVWTGDCALGSFGFQRNRWHTAISPAWYNMVFTVTVLLWIQSINSR